MTYPISYLQDHSPKAERSFDDSGLGSGLVSASLDLFLGASVTRNPRSLCYNSVMMRSVDDWPLAKNFNQISGGKPQSVSVSPEA